MQYYDIYIDAAWKRTDPKKDEPNGEYLVSGADRACVYAAIEHGTVWLCRVTEGQLAQLKKDGVAFDHFSTLDAGEKAALAPRHVIGGELYEPGDKPEEVKVWKPNKTTPEIVPTLSAVELLGPR